MMNELAASNVMHLKTLSGLILGWRPANERQRYFVMTFPNFNGLGMDKQFH